jgi:hypothetical protein
VFDSRRNHAVVLRYLIPSRKLLPSRRARFFSALVYIGKSRTPPYDLEEDITVHITLFDLEVENEDAFKYKCDDFIHEIRDT